MSKDMYMEEEKIFDAQMKLVFSVQRNKRRGHDSLVYENNVVALTVRGMYERIEKTLRIRNNYAFLTSLPRWREIMATEFEGRKIDHELCDPLIPYADRFILSPYTFNNRKGKGAQAAINQLIDNICEVSDGYTKPARVIKLDFSGYFPNALWNYAEKCIVDVIDKYSADMHFSEEEVGYMKWLAMIAVHCNPAGHCTLRSPRYLWAEHIDKEKSILFKPLGVGAGIGRLVWQMAMGLYINDIIIWLTEECGLKVVCFGDDIVITVREEHHQYALSILPEMRQRLAGRNVHFNEKKFYDQPYQHGLEFLGSHIKPYRLHLNNSSYSRAIAKIKRMNACRYKDINTMVSSFNSYSGLLKNRTDYRRLMKMKTALAEDWWTWLHFDEKRQCLAYNKGFSVNERLNKKYNLKLKRYERTRSRRNSNGVRSGKLEDNTNR